MPTWTAASKSTSQRMPGPTACIGSVGGVAGGVPPSSGSGPTASCSGIGFPSDAEGPTGRREAVADGDPAVGQQRGARGARPGGGVARRAREVRRGSQRLVVGRRRRWSCRDVARFELAGDPGGALRLEAAGELRPRGGLALGAARLRASAPELFPVILAPRDLVVGQLGLVGIDVQVVGVDADQQIGPAAAKRGSEARLEANGQQDDGHAAVERGQHGLGHGRRAVA